MSREDCLTGMLRRLRRLCCVVLFFALFVTALPHQAGAAWPNKKIVITDLLDDDIRALIHLLSDPKTGDTVSAIVVSTGNTQLKAEIAKAIVAAFDLQIPVYAGTSSDLSNNPVTQFAANFEMEGKHVLDEATRLSLKQRSHEDGDGADQILSLIKKHSHRDLDILCLAAPVDLVAAIRKDSTAAKEALGDLFIMGLYKETAAKKLVAPYNTMAGPDSVFELMSIYNEGAFNKIYHVPSDTVQQRSNLNGGYFPEDADGKIFRDLLTEVMKKNPALQGLLKAAQEYGFSWWSTAAQQFGTGLTDDSRWVTGTLKDAHEAAGFYIADTIPTELANLDAHELAALEFKETYVSPPANLALLNKSKQFEFVKRTGPGDQVGIRPFIDLHKFDGRAALNRHLTQLSQRTLTVVGATQSLATNDARAGLPFDHSIHSGDDAQSKALLVTFKNSPDDWFALLRILASKRGRLALERGGIICEGFETQEMARAVQEVLEEFGVSGVKVAGGYEYSDSETASLPNFKGERAFYGEKQGFRAFAEPTARPVSTPREIVEQSTAWAKASGASIDLLVLGEGIDVVRLANSNPEFAKHIASAYVMGGGRMEESGKIKFTRNWLVHRKEVLDGLEKIGAHGGKVFVFSTNEFGGMLVAHSSGTLGNGAVAFKALDEFGGSNSTIKSILDHWSNWTRTFDWVIKRDGVAFDPHLQVNTLTISPLGLHIADAWSSQFIERGRADWAFEEFSPSEMMSGESLRAKTGSGVFWVQQKGGQKIEPVALRFEASLDVLVAHVKHAASSRRCDGRAAEEILTDPSAPI